MSFNTLMFDSELLKDLVGEKRKMYFTRIFFFSNKVQSSHNSVSSAKDLRTVGRRFYPQLGQYSCQGLIIDIAKGFLSLSPLSIVSTMAIWENN